ncbi:cell wall-associated NlpC family hydrolase [Agromyces sp. 3263]|uniref:C40 family peptidase n=1 Tax=Agromyces sp. 3263 TaxID=2817750 RepID=UPI00285AA827|nr:C40 family peptidase [Agromyces sp. 3263]MDR6906599.1 cell wall-associated NlpC family hydrolase [Agromyces sp. 3263]
MADHRTRPVSRVKPATVFSTVAVGAVTASVVAAGGPAMAEPDYPSWSEIEQAKQNEQTKQAEIDRVGALLVGLQQAADAAAQASMMADEAWRIAIDQRDRAAERERALGTQADEADAIAEISKMRAGLLAAHLAKTAGADLTAELVFSGDDSTQLLQQLGMASKLGEQSNEVYEQAVADRNTADSLRDQAADAAAERQRLAALAEQRADEARAAADAAAAAVAEQEEKSTELYAQLASLKDTTADLERRRVEGQAQEAAEAAARAAAAAAAAAAAQQPASPGGASGGGGSGSGGSGGGAPAPNPAPAPPNSGAVETAIWFASQQLGEPYRLGGAGPNVWDCSGLTKVSYAQAGISIGTHSATNQYYTLAGRGLAVPLSQIQRGDLLFWGSGGDYYHVAIYLGGGRILEAPREGVPVREYFIWGSPSAAARPAG